MSSATSVGTPKVPINPTPSRGPSHRKTIFVLLVIAAAVVCLAILYREAWPFSQKAVMADLGDASDSEVTIRSSRQTYFPTPGCILEGVVFRHGPDRFTIITVEKLTIEGSYLGILTQHVPRITAEGAHIFVPPFDNKMTFDTEHSSLVVDEIVANNSVVDFESDEPHKAALRFEVHEARMNDVRWGNPFRYHLKFQNPKPPGELAVNGSFGPYTKSRPEDTPFSGEYTFDHADLGVYGGVAGMLTSKGKFGGVFKHIDISGTTDTPDFEVTTGKHKVKLQTQFDAFVDAMHGDTFLKRVEAHFGRTIIMAEGSIAGAKSGKGKEALLRLTSRRGRIEDILGLFTSERRAPMSGVIGLRAQAEIPPGDKPFLEKVKLQGTFGIDEGAFTKRETQQNVDELSAGARGENKEDPETVLTDLKGSVELTQGIAHFSDLSFGIPGADAGMEGTYNLLNHKIDLHGKMRVDTKISKTASGVKALMLKIMDPIFKKKKHGEVVLVHIAGTYEKPQFGLDLTPQNKKQARK